MDHPYQLLVVDVDGTLLHQRIISLENTKALTKLCDSGIKLALSTGRALGACRDIINHLSLTGYHIFFDGALVANSQAEEVYVQFLNPTTVKQAIDFAHIEGIDIDLYSVDSYFVERETWSATAHRDFFKIEPKMVDFDDIWEQEKIVKIGLVAISSEERIRVQGFCSHFSGICHFSWARTPMYNNSAFINVVAPGVSKGRALQVLSAYLGISSGETIAIGDGINDIPLFKEAGLAVAMANAPDEVKAVADFITLDVADNGLAAVIDKFLL